jgi:hypothetical protein
VATSRNVLNRRGLISGNGGRKIYGGSNHTPGPCSMGCLSPTHSFCFGVLAFWPVSVSIWKACHYISVGRCVATLLLVGRLEGHLGFR